MNTGVVRRTLLLAGAGHCLVLSLFAFSFPAVPGARMRQPFPALKYCGEVPFSLVLRPPDLPAALLPQRAGTAPAVVKPEYDVPQAPYGKPLADVPAAEKKSVIDAVPVFATLPRKHGPVLLFHPLLPYQLQLYFKDRQEVHIELQFRIDDHGDRTDIEIKRKISSGNIEADLLSLRNISHYLFIQKGGFQLDQWYPVKIDLSTSH